MTYNLFTVERLQPSRISDALAASLHTAPVAVDVADVDGDQDDRDWDALVLCDYSHVPGDVALALDVFAQDAVTHRPDEAELALRFAAAAGTVVLYPATEQLPSAYWLVNPSGLVTRARLTASDDERPVYSIDAVEAAVPELPGIRVMQLPEIVREQHVSTPVTAEFSRTMDSLRTSRKNPPDPALADEPGTTVYLSRVYLAEWERMVRRMESDWQPDGRFPAELYLEALRARDHLTQLATKLVGPVQETLRNSVDRLDQEFRKHTEPDDTWPFAAGLHESATAVSAPGWWWRRKPLVLPWEPST
jgi:hypothetical protein